MLAADEYLSKQEMREKIEKFSSMMIAIKKKPAEEKLSQLLTIKAELLSIISGRPHAGENSAKRPDYDCILKKMEEIIASVNGHTDITDGLISDIQNQSERFREWQEFVRMLRKEYYTGMQNEDAIVEMQKNQGFLTLRFDKLSFRFSLYDLERYYRIWNNILSVFEIIGRPSEKVHTIVKMEDNGSSVTVVLSIEVLKLVEETTTEILSGFLHTSKISDLLKAARELNLSEQSISGLENDIRAAIENSVFALSEKLFDTIRQSGSQELTLAETETAVGQLSDFIRKGGQIAVSYWSEETKSFVRSEIIENLFSLSESPKKE